MVPAGRVISQTPKSSHRVRVRGPLVEVADEERGARGGRPLAVRDLAGRGLLKPNLRYPWRTPRDPSASSMRPFVSMNFSSGTSGGPRARGAARRRRSPCRRRRAGGVGVAARVCATAARSRAWWRVGGGGGSPGALGATLAVRANHAALTRVNRPARYDVGRDRGRDRAAPDGHFGAPEKTEVEAVGGLGRSPRGGAFGL